MDKKTWLRGEIGKWREEGLVDAGTAARLEERYAAAGRVSWGILLAGAVGAFLVGLGAIALVAANWDGFGKAARVGVSALPLAACGVTAVWAGAKGKTGAAVMEPLGLLWLAGVAVASTVVAQTYQVGDSVAGLLLFIAVLAYSALWATRGRIAVLVWTVFALVWVFVRRDEAGSSWPLALGGTAGIVVLSAAAWVFAARSWPAGGLTASARAGMGLAYAFGVPLAVAVAGPWHLRDAWYFGYFFAGAALVGGAGWLTGHRAWSVAGTLVAVGAAVPTFLAREFGEPGPMMVWYCGSLVYAAALAVRGIVRRDLWVLNAGVLLGAWLVLAKFFESKVDFTVKGLVLIAAGAAVLGVNVWLVRMKKREAGT
jgi:hypothetical protein